MQLSPHRNPWGNMRPDIHRALLAVLLITFGSATTTAAQTKARYRAPRNEYGQADLRGVWNFNSDVPLERPKAFADKKFFTREELAKEAQARETGLDQVSKLAPVEIVDRHWLDYRAQVENLRTSLIIYPENGRVPQLLPGVQRTNLLQAISDMKGTRPVRFLFGGIGKDGPEDRGLAERCIAGANTRPPYTPGFDSNYVQIFQNADHVVLVGDGSINAIRIVPLDGRPHLRDNMRTWSGDSRGHWDGDTLVIETKNFNGRMQSFADAGTSAELIVTERFTRVSDKVIEYEATVVDPKTFTDKIVMAFPMGLADVQMFESACHEGNYSMPLTLSGARKEEQDAAKK